MLVVVEEEERGWRDVDKSMELQPGKRHEHGPKYATVDESCP